MKIDQSVNRLMNEATVNNFIFDKRYKIIIANIYALLAHCPGLSSLYNRLSSLQLKM